MNCPAGGEQMNNSDSAGRTLKRELIRAVIERTQSMNMKSAMNIFVTSEPVVYEDVEETLNVPYMNRDETALAMDIFKPMAAEGVELPVIVIIHGGGLCMGDRGFNRPYSRLLAHKGYLVFSLEYRLAPRANLCQQLDDVCAGMDLVGQKLVDYDVDFTRIFLVADSAGAFIGAYVSAMHSSTKLQNAIGYKPSRLVYAAVGFLSGMFYTNKVLQEQIYGDRRNDETFLKYMDIEHPEIIENMPPAFLVTSCGDIFNDYSIRFNKALKKKGRTSRLLYFGDEELMHVFPITKTEHPRSIEATDRMLSWFEEQADIKRKSWEKDSETEKKLREVEKRIQDGSICSQRVWAYLKERISADDRLMKRTAVIDCTRRYTYQQMFDEWERYARVFSALGICAENGSRAALCGVITAEPLFALFGLNMTGAEVSLFSYPDFLPNGMWKSMIEKEKITDLIVSDIMVTPEIREEIKKVKAEYGLRNVIYMHSLMGGPTVGPAEVVYNEYNYHMLKRSPDAVFLNDLLTKYAKTPIRYDDSAGEKVAFIMHTSGTTHGTRKFLPFTDKVMNETQNMMPVSTHQFVEGPEAGNPFRVLQVYDLSSIMALAGQVISPLSIGDALVFTYFGFMHPKFIRAIDYYNIDAMQITGFMVDKWIEFTGIDDLDFSSLKVIGMSGGYISPEKMAKYREFFKAHGYRYDIVAAYGTSEAGGKPMFAPKGNDRDILGFSEDSEQVRIQDENDGSSIESRTARGQAYCISSLKHDAAMSSTGKCCLNTQI